MKLLADYREPKNLLDLLSDVAEVTTLACGDYLFCSSSGLFAMMERKTVGDLLASIASGRLHDQLERVSSTVDIPILLVEGIYSQNHEGYIRTPSYEYKWRYDALENLLLAVQLRGIVLARTPSLEASVKLIRGYHAYFTREERSGLEMRKARIFRFGGKPDDQLRVLCSLPGVNVTLAQRLRARFGSISAIVNASEKELQSVEGIGEVKAQTIYNLCREGAIDITGG